MLTFVTISTLTLRITSINDVDINVNNRQLWQNLGKRKGNSKTMGMSSSQARLLSLTGRMHDIELKAQRIQAQKLRLANESQQVYESYLDALELKKYVASVVGRDGNMTDIPLTAKAIYTYNTLMDQYALKTRDGKSLMPSSLHSVYQSTNSLSEYLTALGLDSTYTQTIHHEDPNPAYQYQYSLWSGDMDSYNARYQDYLDRLHRWELIEIPEWESLKPDPTNPIYIIPGTTSTGGDKYDDFLWATGLCYSAAMSALSSELGISGKDLYDSNGAIVLSYTPTNITCYSDDGSGNVMYTQVTSTSNRDCYEHVLDHLLRVGTHTTTTGQALTISEGNHWWSVGEFNDRGGRSAALAEVFALDASPVLYCSEGGLTLKNELMANPTNEKIKLLSNYYYDGGGNLKLKTIYQKIVDLDYAHRMDIISAQEAYDQINQFTDYDIRQALSTPDEFNEALYNADLITWQGSKPPKPEWNETPPVLNDYICDVAPTIESDETVQHTTFTDPNMAQWYINLWCKLEGIDDTPKVQTTWVHNDATGCDAPIYSVDSRPKSSTTYGNEPLSGAIENENYIVISDDMLDDPDWIYDTVSEGFVLLQEWDSVENKWRDVSVANATRISEVSDKIDLKKAEAEYEAKMRRINQKDARYDKELSVCENERQAIKTEMDTLKTVIRDNVDLNFKLFS